MQISERIRLAREQKRLTQKELATQLGVAQSTITGYENGHREPDIFKIKELSKILDVDANYLLDIPSFITKKDILWNSYSFADEPTQKIIDKILDIPE